jgi:hypothetical protein
VHLPQMECDVVGCTVVSVGRLEDEDWDDVSLLKGFVVFILLYCRT